MDKQLQALQLNLEAAAQRADAERIVVRRPFTTAESPREMARVFCEKAC